MFDIRFYINCWRNENLHGMTKSTFNKDTSITYLEKVIDEMTKIHTETNSKLTQIHASNA